ncbi:hypothetical protein QVM86_04290 [Providencia stuartii]|nr:hypothetical protein [Providencia thailandensis]MDN0018424.1 hypothetical protein [Providencia stuartii]
MEFNLLDKTMEDGAPADTVTVEGIVVIVLTIPPPISTLLLPVVDTTVAIALVEALQFIERFELELFPLILSALRVPWSICKLPERTQDTGWVGVFTSLPESTLTEVTALVGSPENPGTTATIITTGLPNTHGLPHEPTHPLPFTPLNPQPLIWPDIIPISARVTSEHFLFTTKGILLYSIPALPIMLAESAFMDFPVQPSALLFPARAINEHWFKLEFTKEKGFPSGAPGNHTW